MSLGPQDVLDVPPMIGRQLGPYRIDGLLGRGGMGEVYRAHDSRLGRDIALKVLPIDVHADPERRARFEREARAIAAIDHPNVVTIHTVEEIDGRLVLTMELVEGQTLDEFLPAHGLPLDQLLELAIPLADALGAAHAQGITHRDLKPANVMVDRAGRVRVLDFGLAKIVAAVSAEDQTVAVDATAEGRILGTSSYMSPEQAEGKPVDPRSDVFSLGVLLYVMATGQRPFTGDTPISTITSILRDEPVPVRELKPGLPDALGQVVRRCLEKDPDRRYESARGLKLDLARLKDEPVPRTARPPASRRAPVFLGILVVVLLAGAGLYFSGVLRTETNGSPSGGPVAPRGSKIVVFPFENLGEPADAFFASGISDEISNRLTALPGVSVLSRSTARQYDRTERSMQQIAEDLGVDYVLEGTVRWLRDASGNRLRVSPVLVRASTDEQTWAESYDRRMEEVFEIQSEIAGAVARRIGAELSVGSDEVDVPTRDVQAYQLYLQASQLLVPADRELWSRGTELLESAVTRDPEFARAWALLARAHSAFVHFAWDRSPVALQKAENALLRAQALDPQGVWTRLAEGYVAYWGKREYADAERAFRLAMTQRPGDPEVMTALGYVQRRRAEFEDALRWMQRALEAEPSNWNHHLDLAETLGILRRYPEAMEAIDRALALKPDRSVAYAFRAVLLNMQGRIEEAITTIESAPTISRIAESAYLLTEMKMALLDYDGALASLEGYPEYLPEQFADSCRWLYQAQTLHLRDGPEAAAPYYERALEVIRREVARRPQDANPVSLLGLALASSGAHDEGIAEARRALEMVPADRDLWQRQTRYLFLILAMLWADRPDEAEPLLRELCRTPNNVISREFLRAAPLFSSESPLPGFAAVADFEL